MHMKKKLVIIVAVGVLFLAFQSFRPDPPAEPVFPDEVTTILTTSCFNCHTTGSNAEKALNAVNFKEWDSYRLTKQVGILSKMTEVLEKKKMPPEKFLERNPEAVLSDTQREFLVDWAKQESEKLMQGN
jgi:hypothetical protein